MTGSGIPGLLLAVAAAVFLSGTAAAQRYGHPPPPGLSQLQERNNDANGKTFDDGKQALMAKNYRMAESLFRDVLRHNPNNPEANFLMGVTQMSQDKWPEAKQFLEVAVRKDPKNADPKSRLAVAYIRLGEMDAANEQRAALQKMSEQCKGKCRNAEWIAGGLAMVDGALANAAAAPGAPAS